MCSEAKANSESVCVMSTFMLDFLKSVQTNVSLQGYTVVVSLSLSLSLSLAVSFSLCVCVFLFPSTKKKAIVKEKDRQTERESCVSRCCYY